MSASIDQGTGSPSASESRRVRWLALALLCTSVGCGAETESASPSRDTSPSPALSDTSADPEGLDVVVVEEVAQGDASRMADDVSSDADTGPGDAAWIGARHPAPPDDLPPVPDPPESFGPGFIDLSDGLYDPAPFGLFEGSEGDIPSPTTALFGDVDGDGVQEVLVSTDSRGVVSDGPRWEVVTTRLYRLAPETQTLVLDPDQPLPVGHVLAFMDLDGDGRDDLLTLGPSTVHWGGEVIEDSIFLEEAGGGELLGWKGMTVSDVDRDGLLDLIGQPVTCCDLTCPELAVVLATGRRHYRAHPELIETVNHANVCATLQAPVGTSTLLMSFAAVSKCGGLSHVFYEEVGLSDTGYPRFEALTAAGDVETMDLALSSPMGGSVADVDGDGDFDLTITTDPHHVMYRAEPAWPLTDVTTWTAIGHYGLMLPPEPVAPDRYMIPWGAAFLDLDRDGRVDVLYSHGADPDPGGNKAVIDVGPQYVSAHWNGGQWRFAEVSEALGLKRLGEWRALTLGDLDQDGHPDLGVGGLGEFPRIYLNEVATPGQGLALRLKGTTSNHLGLGAIVRLTAAPQDAPQWHVMGHVGNPYGVSQPLIFAGLGAATSASSVLIRWPSGFEQVVEGLEAGMVHAIEEPQTIAISPWSRRLDHQGGESAFITLTARQSDGTLRQDAELNLAVVAGVGELSLPPTPVDGGLRWEIQAPGVVGSTLVEAQIDGVTVGIRPRIFWH